MSPIGRIFTVLNLVLAGAFVYFSGSYLQNQTSQRTRAEQAEANLKKVTEESTVTVQAKDKEISARDVNMRGITSQLSEALTKNEEQARRLTTQEGKLGNLEALIAKLEGHAATTATAIDKNTADTEQARKLAIESSTAAQEAKKLKETAEAAAGELTQKVAALEAAIKANESTIAGLTQTNKEKDVMLALASSRFPGLFGNLQATMDGRVEVVSPMGDLVTINVTNKPEGVEIKPGNSFAVWGGTKYKGEAIVTEVKDNMAFAKLTRRAEGATISVGDRASTNPGGN